MKISKISVILFIFLLALSLAPHLNVTSSEIVSNQPNDFDQVTTQSVPDVLGAELINASLSNVKRNVTVLTSGLVSLEDGFKLNVIGEDLEIATLNYSIPTAFAGYTHEVKFFTQFEDNIGIDSPNNSRKYTVFYGEDVTTYQIDIRQNGETANSTTGGVFVRTTLNAIDILTVEPKGTGQKITADLPLVPMFPNFKVTGAVIGIALQGNQDSFVRPEITRIENELGNLMPTFTDVENILTYRNMSRLAYDYRFSLEETDLQTFTFQSETPLSLDEQSVTPTATVPIRIHEANRIVRFDPWGSVYVQEEITVLHQGAPLNTSIESYFAIHQVAGFQLTFDEKAILTDVHDAYGSLTLGRDGDDADSYPDSTISGTDGKRDFSVNFRNPIYGGETYTFIAEFKYNASEIISKDDSGMYSMNTTLFSDYNITTSNMHVEYEFPLGTTFSHQTYQSRSRFVSYTVTSNVDRNSLSAFNHFELVFDLTNASYVDNVGFQIFFEYNGLGHFQYAATYLYVTIAILGLVYVMSNLSYKPSRAIEIEREQIPIAEMDAFFNYFSEKAGAEKRIAELRSKRQKGKLSKQDYDGQVKAIQKRLRDINPQLEDASKKLSSKGGRYENYVKRVMLASERQIDIRRNAREAKVSYEKGNIPKDIYQLRVKELNESLKKEESTINKTLTEMVEIIQKFNQ